MPRFPRILRDSFTTNNFEIANVILRLGIGLTSATHGAQKLFGWSGGFGLAGWQGAMTNGLPTRAPLRADVNTL